MQIIESILADAAAVTAIRRDIHAHPELCFQEERTADVIAKGQALQRSLEAEDLVGTIVYLASDASKFVTGQTIMVDGGTVFL